MNNKAKDSKDLGDVAVGKKIPSEHEIQILRPEQKARCSGSCL